MTLATVKERVEKRRTSPDWVWDEEDPDEDEEALLIAEVPEASGVVGDGTGDG